MQRISDSGTARVANVQPIKRPRRPSEEPDEGKPNRGDRPDEAPDEGKPDQGDRPDEAPAQDDAVPPAAPGTLVDELV